ncbi:hypothetical protein GCM10009565_19640 [Amycolatopsis albidoflavus]
MECFWGALLRGLAMSTALFRASTGESVSSCPVLQLAVRLVRMASNLDGLAIARWIASCGIQPGRGFATGTLPEWA